MGYETVRYEEVDGVAWVTLDRPEVHNAFNRVMREELQSIWRGLRRNDDVRVVVLTGAGEDAFCTGIDRHETFEEYLANPRGDRGVGRATSPYMWDSPGPFICPKQCDLWKPVVAAVNGMACAGGLYLLGESDIIIAAEHATFFDPHVTYGLVSGFESIHLLQKLPLGETLRMGLMGAHERITAQRAHQVGLVSEVVPMADLHDRAAWIAGTIASAPPLAIQGTLRAIWVGHEHTRRDAIDLASAFVALGSEYDNIEAGQKKFKDAGTIPWQPR